MEAWKELHWTENMAINDRFQKQFLFCPEKGPEEGPTIKEPVPSITFSISRVYQGAKTYRTGDEGILWRTRCYRTLEDDLNIKMLRAFQQCLHRDQWLYALNWYHPGYQFYPHHFTKADDADAWRVPVLPNGDYYIFLSEHCGFGTFGDFREDTICIFGSPLLNAVQKDPPRLFLDVVRDNGQTV